MSAIAALELVERCGCPAGCPGCVGPSIGDHGTNKRAAVTLLRRLCEPDAHNAARPAEHAMAPV